MARSAANPREAKQALAPPPGTRELRAADYPFLYRDRAPDSPQTTFVFCLGEVESSRIWLNSPLLNCPTALMSVTPILALSCPIESAASALLRETGRDKVDGPILTMGVSLAGFTALIVGAAMAMEVAPRRVHVVAFSPPTLLWPNRKRHSNPRYVEMLKRVAESDGLAQKLERYGDARSWAQAAAERAGDSFSATIYVGADNKSDNAEAKRLEGIPGVEIVELPTDQHSTLFWLMAPVEDRAMLEAKFAASQSKRKSAPEEAEVKRRAIQAVDTLIEFRRTYPDLKQILNLSGSATPEEPSGAKT